MQVRMEELKNQQIREHGEQQRKTMDTESKHHKQRAEYEDILSRRRYEDQLMQQVCDIYENGALIINVAQQFFLRCNVTLSHHLSVFFFLKEKSGRRKSKKTRGIRSKAGRNETKYTI